MLLNDPKIMKRILKSTFLKKYNSPRFRFNWNLPSHCFHIFMEVEAICLVFCKTLMDPCLVLVLLLNLDFSLILNRTREIYRPHLDRFVGYRCLLQAIHQTCIREALRFE